MELIKWSKAFEVGKADVDHEHRELIELINTLYGKLRENAEKTEIADFLGEVFARISAHFALEETIMRKYRYEEYEAHKSDHEALLDQLRDIMDDFEENDSADYAGALSDAVRDWFTNHFKTMDARLHGKLGV